ncbi:MAG: ATP-dependent Clp protease proteolytic subunit [Minwuia sp.]|uniref:ATP-dependent Clp protease proteolytic subunit n=1 Tax=Minwuia sp. TaxID=2493630 RepID=UPI003A838A88
MPDLAGSKIAFFGFTGAIDPNGASRIAAAMNHAVNNDFDEVVLSFSSNGGYVADGIFLYNHIQSLPIKVTIYNTGSVSSIAVAIFVAAETRYCSQHSMFMIHPTMLFPGQDGMTSERLQASLNAALFDDSRTEEILRNRTSLPQEVLNARRFKDFYIRPQDAVDWGLVNGVREFSLPNGNQITQI